MKKRKHTYEGINRELVSDLAREFRREGLSVTEMNVVFRDILTGRLAGYTPKNCEHPREDRRDYPRRPEKYICGRCGYMS